MKPIPDFGVDLPWIEMVRASESQAVIEEESPVGDIHALHRERPAFSDTLPERQIEGGVLGQTGGTTVIREP
jgi:hypothetical protein